MPERDNKRPVTAEDWSDYLQKFAARTEFGTPEYRAVSDYLNLQNLYSAFGKEPTGILTEVNGEQNLSPENLVRITEQRIALLEERIEQNLSRVPGYSKAYMCVSNGFQDLLGIAAEEAKTRYSREENQKAYVQEIYDQNIEGMSQIVFELQNPDDT